MPIPPEPVDFAAIFKERCKEAAASIHEIDHDEAIRTINGIFPDPTHPWLTQCLTFIDDHRPHTIYQGDVQEGYHFIYCPEANKGIWYGSKEHVRGVGPLRERANDVLSEIISKKHAGG